MNDVMILRRGGGAKLFAAIGVEYPDGSTCTCTGKNSGKVMTAKKSPWIFQIPCADEWTVTIKNAAKSKSKTVEITHEGQCVTLVMSYDLILFNENGLADGFALDLPSITPAVDVTNYTKLRITGKITWGAYAAATVIVGLSAANGGEVGEKSWEINTDVETTAEINLSDITGEWYFTVGGGTVLEVQGRALSVGWVNPENGHGATADLYEIVFS